jgi:xanthine/uracil permease
MDSASPISRGVNDSVPWSELVLVAAQHAMLILAFLVYPLAAAQQLGLSESHTAQFITACIVSAGLATMIHFVPRPWGSGVLAVEVPTPIFLPASVIIGHAGGLGAIAAMSLISGLVGLVFSRLLRALRSLFPAEVCGVAVMLLGISLVKPGMMNAMGLDGLQTTVNPSHVLISGVTLTTIVGIAVFGQHRLRLLALALGLIAGLIASILAGLVGWSEWNAVLDAPWLGWPEIAWVRPSIAPELIPLCMVMALVLSVDNIGMLVSIQRQVNPHWQQIDYRQASAGVSISSVGDVVAALFGGMPTGISSANISLAHATGNVSRRVSLATGLLLILTAFTPRFVTALTYLPKPVIGAVMVYAAAYMLVSGMSLFLTRLLSPRRIFVIGLALVMGLTPALIPGVFAQTPDLIRPILESPLAVGTFSAMALVMGFRFGEAQEQKMTLELLQTRNESLQAYQVNRQLEPPLIALGEQAGAAKEQIDRVVNLGSEFIAILAQAEGMPAALNVVVRMQAQQVHLNLEFTTSSLPGERTWHQQCEAHLKSWAQDHFAQLRISPRGNQMSLVLIFE